MCVTLFASQPSPLCKGTPYACCFTRLAHRVQSRATSPSLLSFREDPNASRKEAAEELRRIVDTVGKPGEAGEQIRCVVSVQMLTEGWDANNVTHILGLRAFGSQLLCEQVVGRGLRRMDYTVDPQTGLLTEEYVDIYGIPFLAIPFKGRPVNGPPPDDRPKNHVFAMDERKGFEMRFPVVENYVVALERNRIKADITGMEGLRLEPDETPTAVFVKPQWATRSGFRHWLADFLPNLKTARSIIGAHIRKRFVLRLRGVWYGT